MPFFRKFGLKAKVETKGLTSESVQTSSSPKVLAKKFAERLEQGVALFEHDERFTKGLVRYKYLKEHISTMHSKFGEQLEARRHEVVEDECAICLEALGNACDVTTTACNHKFHTFCLVETLGSGSCSSCPLCRTEVTKLVPKQGDGASLKLLAKLRLNVDAAQECHSSLLTDIQERTGVCLREAEALCVSKASSSRKAKLQDRVSVLTTELDLVEQFGQINSDGFSRICKKVSKTVSADLGHTLQEQYVFAQEFHQDCHENGNGMTRALRGELKCISGLLSGSSKKSATTVATTKALALQTLAEQAV